MTTLYFLLLELSPFVIFEISLLWFEHCSGHMWESQILLIDGEVVFPQFLQFLPAFNEWLARYKWNILERDKWNILERAIKSESKKKNVIFDSDYALILCPFCKSNTLLNILMFLGRNVEQEKTTCHVQEWQLWLSYFWSYLPLCLNLILYLLCNMNNLQNIFDYTW